MVRGAVEVTCATYEFNMATMGKSLPATNAMQLSIAVTIAGSMWLKFTNGRGTESSVNMSVKDEISKALLLLSVFAWLIYDFRGQYYWLNYGLMLR